ncbi:MAG TPA: hypothetical protein VNL95_05220 [Dehalococcoidia bacterium]|nr:hypothetical protein [Dehalococcoidia bacterium]
MRERRAARDRARAALWEAARQALDLLAEVTAALSGTPLDSEGHRLSYLMAVTAMRSLWAAWELMEGGYQAQAATVVRSALEYWAAAVYLWKRPDQARLWLDGNPRRLPSLEEMRRALPRPYAQRWRRSYDRLSEVAHPRLRAFLAALEEAGHDPLQEGGGPAQAEAVAREVARTALSVLETVPLLAQALEREPRLQQRLEALHQRLKEDGGH